MACNCRKPKKPVANSASKEPTKISSAQQVRTAQTAKRAGSV